MSQGRSSRGGQVLKHLGLWDVNPPELWRVKVYTPSFWRARPPPKGKKSSGVAEPVLDYSDSQVQPSYDYLYCDEIYPVEDPDFSGEVLSS